MGIAGLYHKRLAYIAMIIVLLGQERDGWCPIDRMPEDWVTDADLIVIGTLQAPRVPTTQGGKGIWNAPGQIEIEEVLKGTWSKKTVDILFLQNGAVIRGGGHDYPDGQRGIWMLSWDPQLKTFRSCGIHPGSGLRPIHDLPFLKLILKEGTPSPSSGLPHEAFQKEWDYGFLWTKDPSELRVDAIKPSSVAADSGCVPGDIVLTVEGEVVRDPFKFLVRTNEFSRGSMLKLQVKRENTVTEHQLTALGTGQPDYRLFCQLSSLTAVTGELLKVTVQYDANKALMIPRWNGGLFGWDAQERLVHNPEGDDRPRGIKFPDTLNNGTMTQEWCVPASWTPGRYTLRWRDAGGIWSPPVTLTINAPITPKLKS